MKILWFTNTLMPSVADRLGVPRPVSGGWMSALLEKLAERDDVDLSIVMSGAVQRAIEFKERSISYSAIPESRFYRPRPLKDLLTDYHDTACRHDPDLVHIHGSEKPYALAASQGYIPYPTIVSIQGIMGPCSQWSSFFGDVSPWDLIRMHRPVEILAGRGLIARFARSKLAARREQVALRGIRHIIGRTDWDRSHATFLSPAARYYHVDEMIREPFWKSSWNEKDCTPRRIFVSGAGHPRKGAAVLLDALDLLKHEFPDISVCLAGEISHSSGFGRYLRRKIARFDGMVEELGVLPAEEMARQLALSNVFVTPTLIDNSPNSLCEAQIVGVPVIASHTGGIPSLVQDGTTGLLFAKGDAADLAYRIRAVLLDDGLAARLGQAASAVARRRHEPEAIVKQLLSVYREVSRDPTASSQRSS